MDEFAATAYLITIASVVAIPVCAIGYAVIAGAVDIVQWLRT
jgi:hypothetical protein